MSDILVFLLGGVSCQIVNIVVMEFKYKRMLKRVKEIKIDVDIDGNKTLSEISEMIKKEMEKK